MADRLVFVFPFFFLLFIDLSLFFIFLFYFINLINLLWHFLIVCLTYLQVAIATDHVYKSVDVVDLASMN
jgi:hypothetical protein